MRLFFMLACIFGCLIIFPYHNYLPVLSQGDHGLNLYAARAVMQGQRVYVDFHWWYGPLMPYYYAFCLKVLGDSILSVWAGYLFIKFLTGALIYDILSSRVSRWWAALGAVWYWIFAQDFYYTFSHIGGTFLSLAFVYYYLKYHRQKQKRQLYYCLGSLFLLSLVKLNIGFALLGAFAMVTFFQHGREKDQKASDKIWLYCAALIGAPAAVLGIYAALILSLPFSLVQQCFGYFGNDAVQWVYHTPLENIRDYFLAILTRVISQPEAMYISLLFAASLFIFVKDKKSSGRWNVFISLLIFYVFLLHEYWVSGVTFRLYWGEPLKILILFLVIGWAQEKLGGPLRRVLVIAGFILVLISWRFQYIQIEEKKDADHYLSAPFADVYVGNSTDWVNTISQVTEFMRVRLAPGEQFFALPYEALYFYLLDRASPARDLVLLDFFDISNEQETVLIRNLEQNEVNWVLVSNHFGLDALARKPGHCLLLRKYIEEHFEFVIMFGKWQEPQWARRHAVRIYRRKGL